MYENPKLERLGTFREITQDDDSPCGPISRLWGGDDYGDDVTASCFTA